MIFKYKNHFSTFLLLLSVFVIHSLFISVNSPAQSITWQRLYYPSTFSGDEEAHAMCVADGGNIYVGGFTAPFSRSIYILKLQPNGDTIWTTRNLGFGEIEAMITMGDSGCIFVGESGSSAIAGRIKPDGSLEWLRYYNALSIRDIKRTNSGTFVMCGSNGSGGSYNGYVCEIDSSGDVKFEKLFQGSFQMEFSKLLIEGNGTYIVGGVKAELNGPRNGYIANINNTGLVFWEQIYPKLIFVQGLVELRSGFVICGTYNNKMCVIKTRSNGDTVSSIVFDNASGIYFTALLKGNENKFYGTYSGQNNTYIFSADSDLTIFKQLILQPPQNEIDVHEMIQAPSSNSNDILACGTANIYSFGNSDMYVARLDSGLNMPPPIGIGLLPEVLPVSSTLLQNYPNPFNSSTSIKFDLPYNGSVKFVVYDVLGKEIYILSENMKAGTHEIKFDGSTLASGMYFYRIESKSFTETKKMVLIK